MLFNVILQATMYVVQATGGVWTDYSFVDPKPAWSAVRNNYWGYGKVEIYTQFEFL